MRLKNSYVSREVAALTGLTARQLQWWHARGIFSPSVVPHRTAAGGYTERRYSPVDLLELLVLAELRRQGFSLPKIRLLLDTLRSRFGVRLFEAIGGGGQLTLLTDGREVYARTSDGDIYNVLKDPTQALLVIGEEGALKELSSRVRPKKGKKKKEKRKAERGKGETKKEK